MENIAECDLGHKAKTNDTLLMADRFRVALLIETSKTFGRGVLEGIARFVRAHRSWSIFIDERGLDDPLPPWLRDWKGDGIILRSRSQPVIEAVRQTGVPVVYLGELPEAGFPTVAPDDKAIARQAVTELVNRGFRRFGYAGLRGAPWSDRRRDAFLEQLRLAGFKCSVCEPISEGGSAVSWPEQTRALRQWLTALPKPAGVMACYDVIGLRVLDACREENIAVPEQVAVIGVDNDPLLCELSDPPLTSVAHNLGVIGYEAARLLQDMMTGSAAPAEEILVDPLSIARRQSTDALAIPDADVAKALHFIRRHACDGIKVRDVLKHVPMTEVTLKRQFEKLLGRSAKAEILRLQLERIKELLLETKFTLEQIARLTGFRHADYMSTMFKQRVGCTPGEFRHTRRT